MCDVGDWKNVHLTHQLSGLKETQYPETDHYIHILSTTPSRRVGENEREEKRILRADPLYSTHLSN